MNLSVIEVRNCVSRGMLGNIIPEIRKVMARWAEDSIHLLIFIDGEITDFVEDVSMSIMHDTVDEVPSEAIEVSWDIIRCDFPEVTPKFFDEENIVTIFERYERYPQDTDTPYPPLKE